MSGESWSLCTLGDAITLKRGYDLPKRLRTPGPHPVVSSAGPSGCHSEAKVDGPGVVTGRYGTLGEVFWVPHPFWPLNTALYVRDFKGNDPRFAFYLLRSLDLAHFNDKSGVPGVNRNDLHQMEVLLPPVEEQRAIAHLLGALDDKIELNHKTNDTLAGLCQALFKSWFVDFDPVVSNLQGDMPSMDPAVAALFPASLSDSQGDVAPSGWASRPLAEAATYINGKAFRPSHFAPTSSGLPVVKIAEIKHGVSGQTNFTEQQCDRKFLLRDGDILFSWSGSPETSIDTFIWSGGAGWLNQHIFKVVPDRGLPRAFVFCLLKSFKGTFIALAKTKQTTGLGHVTRHDLRQETFTVPPSPVLECFADRADPLLAQLLANLLQSRTLAALRDLLLPKLLSGEIRLREAEELVEEAV